MMSALVSLEGSLGDVVPEVWTPISSRLILMLLLNVFNTLTTAMRYEPANAKFFHQEVCTLFQLSGIGIVCTFLEVSYYL